MILECDIGNTRCKWRVVDGRQIVERGSFALMDGFERLIPTTQIERIKMGSVVAAHNLAGLADFCDRVGVSPEFAQSTPEVAGVVNAYQDASKLGVDRWLAVVAGYHRKKAAVLVIDAGTALKADLVSADGRHLGGYIAPGMSLMEASLFSGTDQVRFDCQGPSAELAFGCATADAVNAGIQAAQIGAVTVAIAEAERQIPQGFAILLTGGDAASIASHLGDSYEIEWVPELVLDGLQWLLP